MRYAFGGAAMLALLPWLDPWLLLPAVPVAGPARPLDRAPWPLDGRARHRREIQLASLVFYVSLNERLYGGLRRWRRSTAR